MKFNYLFSRQYVGPEFDFTERTFANVFADNVMTYASLSAFFVIWRRWLWYIR